eukprot:8012543-Ditylum_brightwellii.AAC.1
MALWYRDAIMTGTCVPGYQLMVAQQCHGDGPHETMASCWCYQRHLFVDCCVLLLLGEEKRVFLGGWSGGGGGGGAEVHVLAPCILWLMTAMTTAQIPQMAPAM